MFRIKQFQYIPYIPLRPIYPGACVRSWQIASAHVIERTLTLTYCLIRLLCGCLLNS